MQNLVPNDWQLILQDEFEKEYWSVLEQKVEASYANTTCYPHKKKLFSTFDYCSFKELKVVILGQDPYHGAGQAHGLCFSYLGENKFPPSLKNIYKEISTDLNVQMPVNNGDLSPWAKQGVLLLNTTLTVEESKPNSHKSFGWSQFTDEVIRKISEKKENVVFLLWGGFAHKKESLIDTNKHYVLKATHPSPLGANKGGWFGCQHFSKTNAYLKQKGMKEIYWQVQEVNQQPDLFNWL
ncbi:uracil-DNA glycosylase [Wenyingzhuangia sp. 1_MG-2023]|nr:uracil-DNA glycosylase [Wenyingzhuangia sp. 1_MG-2023]